MLSSQERSAAENDHIDYQCPRCGAALAGTESECPSCHTPLDAELYATYRPRASRARRVVALVVLIACFVIPMLLFLWSMWAS